ncbi:MAG: hypothetical protein KBA66_00520 [Leptospiraceae bacterium]|nr:hypothetical protein [Leptospiraceae bacterium]
MKILLLQVILLFVHCQTNLKSNDSFPIQKNIANLKTDKNLIKKNEVIAITPLVDRRTEIFIDGALIFIPLVLWETNEYDSHGESGVFQITKDYTYAIHDELNSYPFFSEIYITEKNDFKDANYIVKGEIYSTKQKITETLFGMSLLGIFPRLLGIPFKYTVIELEMKLEFINAKNNKILFSKKYKRIRTKLISVYMTRIKNLPEAKTSLQPYQEIISEFVEDSLKTIGYLEK